jgi:hypothetical protein
VTVIHQENSGWPGRPRNVGLDAARGEFVFFLDNDDLLRPEAMARLVAMARRNGSDIVLGKMAGFHRTVARALFEQNRERATLVKDPLIEALTPHKLFRRELLVRHGLRFPEGRRRLEDHVFVLGAYFEAKTISVLSDYVCYVQQRREDRANASIGRIEPVGYFHDLREVLGIIEEHVEAGTARDRFLERFARTNLLNRLKGGAFLEQSDDYRRLLFDEIRVVVGEHIGAGVDSLLPTIHRTQMGLVRANRLDLVIEFAQGLAGVTARTRLREVGTAGGHRLHLGFDAWLEATDGATAISGDDGLLAVSDEIASVVGDHARRIDPASQRVQLVLRSRVDWSELTPPLSTVNPSLSSPELGTSPWRVTVEIDPDTVSLGQPIWPGTWDLLARVQAFGMSRDVRLGATRDAGVDSDVAPLVTGRLTKRLRTKVYDTAESKNLALSVKGPPDRPLHRRALSGARQQLRR